MIKATTQADQVTFHRAERKFQIIGGDLSYIRRILNSNCLPIIHHKRVSTNRTLYFDDISFSSYDENKSGISRRWKSRIRWYDSSDKTIFFEFKERSNIFSSKDRVEIQLTTPIYQLTYRELKAQLRQHLSLEQYERFLFRSDPVLINEYQREYFRDPHSKIRLTLDYNIGYYNQLQARRPRLKYAHHLPHLIILECKIPVGSPERIERLLNPLRLRLCQSSKYVACLEAMGLSHEIA
jgi:hypothetical protein